LQGMPVVIDGVRGPLKYLAEEVEIGGETMSRFAGITSGLTGLLPGLARGFGTAALLAGEFFAIIKGAEALGRAGVPGLDQFANREHTGSLDMIEAIAERGEVGRLLHDLATQTGPGTFRSNIAPLIPGLPGILELNQIRDEMSGVGKESKSATAEVDRLRASLGKFPDLVAKLTGLTGKGGGGLSAAGSSAGALVKELQEGFAPFGVKADDPLLKQFEQILNNTIGLTPEQQYKELGDQLYKRFHDKVKTELVDPLLEIKKDIDQPGQAGIDALNRYAAESGKKPQEFLKDFQKELADAQTRLADTDRIVKQLIDRGAQEQKDAVEAFHNRQEDLLMAERQAVWDTKGAYDQLNAARAGRPSGVAGIGYDIAHGLQNLFAPGGQGVDWAGTANAPMPRGSGRAYQLGTDMTVSGPTWLHVGEQGTRERILISPEGVGGRGHMGGHSFVIAPTLNYSGSADKAAAARLSADIVDNITEALRQGFRRIGDRSSPFGA
jgi:hypothetical protein